MTNPPTIEANAEADCWCPRGAWTLATLGRFDPRATQHLPTPRQLDLAAVEALDPSGAHVLVELVRAANPQWTTADLTAADAAQQTLVDLVFLPADATRASARRHGGLAELAVRVGSATVDVVEAFAEFFGFVGAVVAALVRTALQPMQLRLTATVHHMERAGFDALPIVGLLSFLIGAVIAYLGANALKPFGGEVFTVELIAVSFMREFGVLLTAIILAGRSGSAFTAEIGAMRMREEVDAMRTLGLDPLQLLVLPRLLALVLMLPLLALVATALGIVGGGLVAWLSIGVPPDLFIARIEASISWQHLAAGMIKAPFFAAVIALVGCLQGMRVGGSAESLGRHTTSAVVQSIFGVILLDALFAMYFMELDF